jgi:ketosteroid isomerase-like protein
MTYESPLAAITALVAARDSGDIPAALACYSANPTLVAQPGTVVSGRDAAQAVLEGFVGFNATFTVLSRVILEAESSALHYSSWTLKGAEGSGIDFAGVSTDVFEKQSDGAWLLSIDNPYGGSILS